MSIIFLGVGDTTLGTTKTNEDGTKTYIPARWEHNPSGGSVIVGLLDPETMEQQGAASVFGDWDAAGYLRSVLGHLNPTRPINIPNFADITKAAVAEGNGDFICQYCSSVNCRDCIVHEWKGE